MQIKNFILSVAGGAVAVEISEREILLMARGIIKSRIDHSITAHLPADYDDEYVYSLSVNGLGVRVNYRKQDETRLSVASHLISDYALSAQVYSLDALEVAAKECK